MNNNKKKYILLISILLLWIIMTFFVVSPDLFKNLNASISDLKIKNNIIVISKNNTRSTLVTKTGESGLKVYSNNTEISGSTVIKTGDRLVNNNEEHLIAVLGDANKDGSVNGSDLSRIYKIYRNLVSVSDVERVAADTNEDNSINSSDLTRAYKIFKNMVQTDDTPVVNYTVTLDSNGGGALSSVTRKSGDAMGTLPTPSRTGYTFTGWYTAKTGGTKIIATTKVTSNMTLYAQWNQNTYTVTFNSNGGSAVSSITRTYNQEIGTLPTPTKAESTLNGWYTASSGGTKITASTKVTSSVTYYAQWTVKTYTATFDSNGGSAVNSITRKYGEKLGTLPTPTKSCNSFGGWYYKEASNKPFFENNKISANTTMPNSNVTYYARWDNNVEREGNYCCSCDSSSGMKKFNDGQYRYVVNKVIQTGWIQYNSNWYYGDSNGTLYKGWQTIGGKTYYFDSNGIMQKSCFINGYWLNADGSWDKGPQSAWHQGSGGKWWYGYSDQSWYAKGKAYYIDSKLYQFDNSGYCYSGC